MRPVPRTVILRTGVVVSGLAVAIVNAFRQAGFRMYLRNQGLRFTVEPASQIPTLLYQLIDSSVQLRDDILEVLHADDEYPPAG
jgi:hypothetical protein